MGCSTLRANWIINRWFICKGESRCLGILLDIRTRKRDAECTHKETNDGRGDGSRKSVCICSAEWNMRDHTSTNATDYIRTPQLRVFGREKYSDGWPPAKSLYLTHFLGRSSCCTHLSADDSFDITRDLIYGPQVYSQMWVTVPWHFTWY